MPTPEPRRRGSQVSLTTVFTVLLRRGDGGGAIVAVMGVATALSLELNAASRDRREQARRAGST